MIIEAENLKKLYRTELVETTALDEVNLAVEGGQFVSIMGPSGCGKSTLLHILGLIDGATEGTYRFLGEDVSRYSEPKRAVLRKRNIGFIFQSFNLIDELTVFENVELPLVYAKVPASRRRGKVLGVLERMDIAHRRDHFPAQLSGGQQQRVAVARAVVNEPTLVLADEPTGNLDSENGSEVMRTLLKLHDGGTSILMVTHSAENAAYGERTIRMLDGRIIAEGKGGKIGEGGEAGTSIGFGKRGKRGEDGEDGEIGEVDTVGEGGR
jgi:putative ABC transport system ATP-binding protein